MINYTIKNKLLQRFCVIFLVVIVGNGCNQYTTTLVDKIGAPSEPAVLWGEMTLKTMNRLVLNTPTYASRALGFMGLTMYESVVNGSDNNVSMVGQISDLNALPLPETGKTYNWVLSMNAGQASMLKRLYDYADDYRFKQIDSLESAILARYSIGQNPDVIARSVQYGKDIAAAIYEYSKTDGGFQGYLRNFEPDFVVPTGPSFWVAPSKGQSASKLPLHPYWGTHRTFSKINSTLPIPAILPYSKDSSSQYYKQMLAVFQKNLILTQSEKEIAAWWADDPTETFSPPGHSYSIANFTIKTAKPDLFKAAETYAHVGMAVADAFVNCWRIKYKYMAERPSTFVQANIVSNWVQLWPEPPFPAFCSGHSIQSSACATVLDDLYGTSFIFTDKSHENRERDTTRGIDFKNRTYPNFQASAVEAGYSRILGGIHNQQDNEIGFAEGKKIGANINRLNWRKF